VALGNGEFGVEVRTSGQLPRLHAGFHSEAEAYEWIASANWPDISIDSVIAGGGARVVAGQIGHM
jgi:hypothetical protein